MKRSATIFCTTMLCSGAALAQSPDRVNACDFENYPPGFAERMQLRPDFQDVLIRMSDVCPDAALALTDAATGATSAQSATSGQSSDRVNACDIESYPPGFVERVQRRPDFQDLLITMAEVCPGAGIALADAATGVVGRPLELPVGEGGSNNANGSVGTDNNGVSGGGGGGGGNAGSGGGGAGGVGSEDGGAGSGGTGSGGGGAGGGAGGGGAGGGSEDTGGETSGGASNSPSASKKNNGFGNGDQQAPGKSRSRNNAENSDRPENPSRSPHASD